MHCLLRLICARRTVPTTVRELRNHRSRVQSVVLVNSCSAYSSEPRCEQTDLLGDWAFVLPVETITLSTDDVFVGPMQVAGLALAGGLATADFLDHDCPVGRILDRFDRFTLVGGDLCGCDVLAVRKQVVDPLLECTQIRVVLLRDTLGEILWQ